jgi:hypothetical protein
MTFFKTDLLIFDKQSNKPDRLKSPLESCGTLRDNSEASGEEDDFKEPENGKQEHQIEEFLATAPPEDEDLTVKRLEEKIQKLHKEFSTETLPINSLSNTSHSKSTHVQSTDGNPTYNTPDKKRKHVIKLTYYFLENAFLLIILYLTES